MANEIVRGTVAPSTPVRSKGRYCLFDPLTIALEGGQQRTLKKASAAGDVAAAIRRGGSGRFYLSTYGGQTGIHGVRMDDGTHAYAQYNNVETMLLIGVAAGLIMLGIGLSGMSGFMITPVIIGGALLVLYIYMRAKRLAAKKQFDDAV